MRSTLNASILIIDDQESNISLLEQLLNKAGYILNLLAMGEAVPKLATEHPDVVAQRPQTSWKQMRGMRNRMAHGYFDIDLDIIWETVQVSLPQLQRQ